MEAQGWTVQLFVLSLTVSSTQAVGWLLWDGGGEGSAVTPLTFYTRLAKSWVKAHQGVEVRQSF